MSVDASSWAWAQQTGKPQLKLLLLKLADHADPQGICWPGQKRLAADCECSVRAIRDNLDRLAKAGLILRVAAFREDGSRKSDYYVLGPTGDRAPMAKVDREHDKWEEIAEAWREARGGEDPPAEAAPPPRQKSPVAPAATTSPAPGSPLPGIEPLVEPSDEHHLSGERARAAMEVLDRVAKAKPCPKAKPESVQAALDAFPEVDALQVAGELEFWELHGGGKAKTTKNLASRFRNFLKNADEDRRRKPAKAPESSVQSTGKNGSADWNSVVRWD